MRRLAIDSVQVIGIYFTVTMEQKDVFYKLLDEHIEKLNGKYKDKFCISQQVYDEINTVLSLDKGEKCDSGSYFKFWCKKNFRLEKIGNLSVVYCAKGSCPIVAKESIFETLVKCYERVGHSGIRKTWDEVKKNYAGLKYGIVALFISTCKQCTERHVGILHFMLL